jgi:hypothetical protein
MIAPATYPQYDFALACVREHRSPSWIGRLLVDGEDLCAGEDEAGELVQCNLFLALDNLLPCAVKS